MARLKFFIVQLRAVQVIPLLILKNAPLTKLVYFSEREIWEKRYLQLLKWYFCVLKLKGTSWPLERPKEVGRFTHGILCINLALVVFPHPLFPLQSSS